MVLDTSCLEQLPFWNELSPSEKALVHGKAKIKNYKKSNLVKRTDRPCPGMIYILSGKVRVYLERLPFWSRLTATEQESLKAKAYIKEYRSNIQIANSKETCLGFISVLSGKIRVYISSDEGREINLFYLESGDCCTLTAACVLSQIFIDTQFAVISRAKVLVIPPQTFSSILDTNKDCKLYVYELIASRFSSIMAVVEQVIFVRLDKRIAQFLLQQRTQQNSDELHLIQQDIANRINSARVAVTRVLNDFVSRGILDSKRGCIVLKDIDALEQMAS